MNRVDDGGEVHLWSAWVDQLEDPGASLALLDDHERARADRFCFERDRDQFVARHAFVRRVLGGYLGVAPAALVICPTAAGRPELAAPSGLAFNASHSAGLAVVAVARERRIGVDIERMRHLDDVMGIADGHLTEGETEWLRSVPQASRSAVFLTLWTRKESVVKAVGGGLSIPLDSFDVGDVGADGVGRPRGPLGDLPFSFIDLDGPDGYVGAITVQGAGVTVREMDVSEVAA